MTATEAEAILEKMFRRFANIPHLLEVNIAEHYVEDWHLDILTGMIGHLVTFQFLLRGARSLKHIGSLAWISRSLLEMSVWADYCMVSKENARRFYEDSFRDTKDMVRSIELLSPLAMSRDPGSSIAENIKKAHQSFAAAAAREDIQNPDASYYKLMDAAKELGLDNITKPIYKVLSKFAHPTALLLVKSIPGDRRFDEVLDIGFVFGAAHATTTYSKLTDHQGLATSDYVVGQVWGASKADRYLLDQVRSRWDMPATKAAVQELSRRWPKAGTKLVEDKANGPAIIQELCHDVPGLIAVNPEGGKMARAQAASPQIESGNVYLPHPALTLWVDDLIEEAAAFPHGRNDDQVDAMTQALNRLRNTSGSYVVPEARITVNPFPVPEEWGRAFAMVVARDRVAAVWGAKDQGGTIYLYAEHALPHAEPSENARAIRALEDSIPSLIHIARSTERFRVAQLYQQLGLNVQSCGSVEEAALFQFWQLLATNKLKIFASLSMFLEEYRIGEDQSPLLRCAQSLVSRPDLMVCKDPEAEDDDDFGGRCVTRSPFSERDGRMR